MTDVDCATDGFASVTASAPGKLILIGEYAVLDGAPAVVMAVDRRARACVTPTPDLPTGQIRVHAPDLDVTATASYDGSLHWPDAATAERLRLVTTVVDALRPAVLSAVDIALDTSAFYETPGRKTGLGSSAALTVALAGALARWAGEPQPELLDLITMHRALQGGRGSGADVAASLTGGITLYRDADTDRPRAAAARLPTGLHHCCVFTGRSASTAGALARLAAWRDTDQAGYRQQIARLSEIAEAGTEAVIAADAAALLNALAAYGEQLDALGRAAGIDIVSADHQRLRNAATACGVIYKPSGAGGGDIGIGISRDADHIDAFRHAAIADGYRIIDISTSASGLDVCGSSKGHSAPGSH